MKYKSTRGSKNLMSSAQAIIKGIAEDRGLYVPERIPELGIDISKLRGLDYRQVASHVLPKF